MEITHRKLIDWNRRGLIPGPNESETSFLQRVEHCLSLKETMPAHLSLPDNSNLTSPILQEALPLTQKLFDISPDWIPLIFSNDKLAPWHGGSAWIFQLKEDSPLGALIQLRTHFQKNTHHLGLYKRTELLTHEMAHACRMAFHEARFEEVLAYQTSSNPIRRFLGGLIQSSYESMIFLLTLLTILFIDTISLLGGFPQFYEAFLWLKAIPFAMIGYSAARYLLKLKQWRGAKEHLKQLLSEEKILPVLYRLTDNEIKNFAHSSPDQIREYAHTQSRTSLRWKVITLAYFQ